MTVFACTVGVSCLIGAKTTAAQSTPNSEAGTVRYVFTRDGQLTRVVIPPPKTARRTPAPAAQSRAPAQRQTVPQHRTQPPRRRSQPSSASAQSAAAPQAQPRHVVHRPAFATPASARRWSQSDRAKALALCQRIIVQTGAEVEVLKPIKRGACGEPAPVRLKALGGRANVRFDPPPVLNCPMVAALADWIGQDLQPAAKKYTGRRIRAIDVMSDYSCRNAYGRKRGRLSQHARANALDIRGFALTDRRAVELIAHWGPTRHQMRRYLARKKKKQTSQTQRAPKIAAAPQTSEPKTAKPSPAGAPAITTGTLARGTLAPTVAPTLRSAAVPTFSFTGPGNSAIDKRAEPTMSLGISRLGGPISAATTRVSAHRLSRATKRGYRKFLKTAHRSACRHFGTVLGPEYDRAHRNHFHVDLANRRLGTFCR
ncbi:MAG: extensin family protein [Pseudomonadota bacterium]